MKKLFVLVVILAVFAAGFFGYRHYRHPAPAISTSGEFILLDPSGGLDAEKPTVYAEAPPNHPPSVIKVGPYHWHVRYVDFGAGEYARSYPKRLEIQLDPSLPVDQLKETVIHELLHTCLFIGNRGVSGGDDMGLDDQYIEATSATLLQVLRDNPELVAWLEK